MRKSRAQEFLDELESLAGLFGMARAARLVDDPVRLVAVLDPPCVEIGRVFEQSGEFARAATGKM